MRPPLNADTRRREQDRTMQTKSAEDSWLVHVIVFILRIFLVLFVAFARAVVIVANEKIPETLFNQDIATAIPTSPSSPRANSEFESSDASQADATTTSSPVHYYTIFVGREVGYTTNSTLMSRLVEGIPNHCSQTFSTLDEAVQAYTEAIQLGTVRRVRTVTQSSGNLEFIYEYMSLAAGIRDLDMPHVPPRPLNPASLISNLPSPSLCDPETCADQQKALRTNNSTGSPIDVANGSMMPSEHWTTHNVRESSVQTVLVSPSASIGGAYVLPGELTIVRLDSDDDSVDSSNNRSIVAVSTHSARSSDIYYTDKRYDEAFAEYIEDEESNAVNARGLSNAAVQTT